MHNKYNKTKNFIQGLRPFSSSIPKTLKKHLKKGGYNYSNIIDHWTRIVNKKISDACYPIKIKMGKGMKKGTLILNVVHGKELEVEYQKNDIIDKINSFFGYRCVDKISLRIIQNSLEKKQKKFFKIKNIQNIEKKMNNIKDKKLKYTLNNFLKAYNEKN